MLNLICTQVLVELRACRFNDHEKPQITVSLIPSVRFMHETDSCSYTLV